MDNPFQCQSPVVGDKFYGRQDIVTDILEDDALSHVWIIGTRRSGKTSILRQLEYIVHREEKYFKKIIPVFWDMQGVTDTQELRGRFLDGLSELKSSSEDKLDILGIVVDDLAKDKNISIGDIFNIISRSAQEKDFRLLLLCDEVEQLTTISKNDEQITSVLRYHFQRKWNKTVIAATGALWNLHEKDKYVSPFLSGFIPPKYTLGRLTTDDALSLIGKIREYDEVPSKAFGWDNEICRLTNQIPYYIQLICETICDYKSDTLEEAMRQAFQVYDLNVILENDLNGFNYIEKLILLHVVEQEGITLNEIDTKVKKEIHISDINNFITNLKLLSYIEETAEQCFYVQNQILRSWYKKNLRKIIKERQPVSFNKIFENLGNVFSLKGDSAQAIEAYQKYLEEKYDLSDPNVIKVLMLEMNELRARVERNKSLRRKSDRLTALHHIDKILYSEKEPEPIISFVVEKITDLLDADRSIFLRIDPEKKGIIKDLKTHGYSETFEENMTVEEINEGLSGYVLRNGEPILHQNSQKHPENKGKALESAIKYKTGPIIVVPLFIKDKVIGTLTAIKELDSSVFNHDDLMLAQLLADKVAIAIHNSKIFRLMKDQIYQLSHTMLSPLSAIDTHFNRLTRKPLSDKARHLSSKIINNEIKRLMHTTRTVLNFSKSEGGILEVKKTLVNICETMKEIKSLFELEARDKNVILEANMNKGPINLMLDEDLMKDVFSNLIKNAMRAITETIPEQRRKIELELKRLNEQVEIRVKDFGVGIKPTDEKKIFEPKYSKFGGFGIGLGVSKSIVERHEGELVIEKSTDKGSTFLITLPYLYKQ